MASNETKRELVDRIYKLRPGQIDAAVDLTVDLIAADYWIRETSEMVMNSALRDETDRAEYMARVSTVPGATDSF